MTSATCGLGLRRAACGKLGAMLKLLNLLDINSTINPTKSGGGYSKQVANIISVAKALKLTLQNYSTSTSRNPV